MFSKGIQTLWFSLLTLLVTTSACNSTFFKPDPANTHLATVTPASEARPDGSRQEHNAATEMGPPAPLIADKSDPISNIPEFVAPQQTNLWHRIVAGMQLGEFKDHHRVAAEISRYSRHQDYIDRVTERARPFMYLIVEQLDTRDMPMEIALLPVVESAFQAFAYSHGRAAGIWQFIPSTGRMFDLQQNWWYDGRRDIVASTQAALDYLQSLHKRMNGDWLLALASYNAGEGNVRRAIRKNKKKGLPTDFWHLPLPDETRAYVPRLLAISAIVAKPAQYNITLKPILNEPAVAEVTTKRQIDLALVAKLADISIEEVYRLNPAFNRWATAPGKQHKLLVPVEKENPFRERLASTPESEFIQWKRHKIRSGETLSHIAHRYNTTVKLLSQVNKLKHNRIRQGKYLLIPVAQQTLSDYSLTRDQRTAARLARSGKGHKRIITVNDGDTFWDLSKKYKVSVKTLARWNGLAPGDTLKPGKKLVLWSRSSAKQAKQHAHNQSLPADTIRTIHYTVRRGDSLALISNKFKVTVKQLRKWNRLQKGQYLQPGQRLKLHVDVTRQT